MTSASSTDGHRSSSSRLYRGNKSLITTSPVIPVYTGNPSKCSLIILQQRTARKKPGDCMAIVRQKDANISQRNVGLATQSQNDKAVSGDFVTNLLPCLTDKRLRKSPSIWRSYGQRYREIFTRLSVTNHYHQFNTHKCSMNNKKIKHTQ